MMRNNQEFIESGSLIQHQNSHHASQLNRLYFQQYRLLYLHSRDICDKIKDLNQQRDRLWTELMKLEVQTDREFTDKFRRIPYEKKPRMRKPQHKINRVNQCNIGDCTKAYGSLGSLLQHQKIKHEEQYQQQRRRKVHSVDQQISSS